MVGGWIRWRNILLEEEVADAWPVRQIESVVRNEPVLLLSRHLFSSLCVKHRIGSKSVGDLLLSSLCPFFLSFFFFNPTFLL